MTGDIRGAWNVDTNVTSLSYPNLISNGDFSSGTTDWLTTSSIVSGALHMVNTGTYGDYVAQDVTTVAGKFYIATVEITAVSGSSAWYLDNLNDAYVQTPTSDTGTFTYSFIANDTSTRIHLKKYQVGTVAVDNISIKEAIPDRSVKGNGLAVHGSPTVSAVATGAELKCISFPDVAGNYLEQPYNADLNYGTGDFVYMGWVKSSAINHNWTYIFEHTQDDSQRFMIHLRASDVLELYANGHSGSSFTETWSDLGTWKGGDWKHFAVVRRGGVLYAYGNGIESASSSNMPHNIDYSASQAGVLTIGSRWTHGDQFSGSMALLRTSATAPTAEQIKEIYEAEKPLFQDNAKCTLNGTSDAVTAMSYDDSNEELLVGTSGGLSVFKGLRRVDENTNNITEVAQQGGLRVEEY
jgi:hypothetical protein